MNIEENKPDTMLFASENSGVPLWKEHWDSLPQAFERLSIPKGWSMFFLLIVQYQQDHLGVRVLGEAKGRKVNSGL